MIVESKNNVWFRACEEGSKMPDDSEHEVGWRLAMYGAAIALPSHCGCVTKGTSR